MNKKRVAIKRCRKIDNTVTIEIWDMDTGQALQMSDIPSIAKPCDCCGGGSSITLFSANKYNSDAEAGVAGCPIGGWYLTGSTHNEGLPEGIAKQRLV